MGEDRERKARVAVIPARGGSKRIPHKNIRMFAGKPIIAHSIEVARASGLFDRVIVSTDSPQIAGVARQWGAEVPFMRPAELSDDHTQTDAVFLHALEWLAHAGAEYEYACLIYPTAPFLTKESLSRGLEALRDSDATSAFSVAMFPFPIQRALRIGDDGYLDMFYPEHRLTRSQDLPDAYHDAGQFYWVRVARYEVERSCYAHALPIVLPRKSVQDIDTIQDWEYAEAMWRATKGAS